jgi:hypothetical protein
MFKKLALIAALVSASQVLAQTSEAVAYVSRESPIAQAGILGE